MISRLTLLELLIATALWMILVLGASRMLWYTTQVSTNLISQQEALESARVAMDALIVNIQMAQEIILHTDPPYGMLRSLSLLQVAPDGSPHWYDFSFDANAVRGQAKYKRLEFGGHNELVSNICEVLLRPSECRQRIHITVITYEGLGKPVTLTSTVDISYKELRP